MRAQSMSNQADFENCCVSDPPTRGILVDGSSIRDEATLGCRVLGHGADGEYAMRQPMNAFVRRIQETQHCTTVLWPRRELAVPACHSPASDKCAEICIYLIGKPFLAAVRRPSRIVSGSADSDPK